MSSTDECSPGTKERRSRGRSESTDVPAPIVVYPATPERCAHDPHQEGAAMLKNRSKWIAGASIIAVSLTLSGAASLTLSGVAVATDATGDVVSTVIGSGTTDQPFRFKARPGTNTVVASFTFGPNSSTGWHTHPGRTLVTVKSGTFTVYHAEECEPLVFGPGDAFVELPQTVHIGRNETDEPVELGVVFFRVPIDGSPRIDQPQPENCDIT
jgi:quercetin dioxygenase-like cupin family protein